MDKKFVPEFPSPDSLQGEDLDDDVEDSNIPEDADMAAKMSTEVCSCCLLLVPSSPTSSSFWFACFLYCSLSHDTPSHCIYKASDEDMLEEEAGDSKSVNNEQSWKSFKDILTDPEMELDAKTCSNLCSAAC
eukprot:767409-Hanusia_phi.AAC.5